MIRSTDHGATWSEPYDSVVSSAHGPCELRNGRLLHVGAERVDPHRTTAGDVRGTTLLAVESTDDGRSWQRLGAVPVRPGDGDHLYLESHATEAGVDCVVAQIRSHGATEEDRELLQTESRDGGRTWATPRPAGFFGFPTHLLRLRDGRLLTTYGHRRPPFGVQARLSTNHGERWSEALVLSDDAVGMDFGYPSTVELEDASLLSVWYDKERAGEAAFLRLARWRIVD
jgi:hypothetical protein